MPKFSVEFYRPVVLGDRAPTFTAVLQGIAALDAPRRIRRDFDPAAILSLTQQDHEFIGEAARIRMDELPSVIDTANGNRHDLNVSDVEGLGEELHFLYDSELTVIAVQNRGHFRASALEQLLSDLSGQRLEFQIILKEDAHRRFRRMEFVSKINFKLARPRDLRGRLLPPLNRVFGEIDEFDGVAAKMEISIGRRRGRSLNLDAIQRLIEAYRDRRDTFKSLSITGAVREDDGPEAPTHVETVDFIKERLAYSQEVDRRGRGRRLDAEGCRVALRRAIREHREHLRRYQ